MDRAAIVAEMRRTAYQKKAVSPMDGEATLDYAITYFNESGYRASRTGRPGQVFILGGREGALPRVTGEIEVQTDIGPKKTTVVTMDAAGERLGQTMEAFRTALNQLRLANRNAVR